MSEVEKLIAKYKKQWDKYGMGSVIYYSQVVSDLEKIKEKEMKAENLVDDFVKEWREKNNTEDAVYSAYHYDIMIAFAEYFNGLNKSEKMKIKEQEAMTFQLEAQLLINRFYELETDGQKMDYDTAVECAKVASKKMIEGGNLLLPEDRLYWRCVLKKCDLLHSQEYLIECLKREEKIYSHDDESGADGTQECDDISDKRGVRGDTSHLNEYAVESKEVHSIVPYIIESQKYPTEIGMYICRMKDGYIKMCHWDGQMWRDAWQSTLKGEVKNWMKIPTNL